MRFFFLARHALGQLLPKMGCLAVILAAQFAAAQTPKPEGSEKYPSDYRYPLRTWVQKEPLSFDLPARKPRVMDTAAGLMGKLQNIVIPRIEFRNTSMRDAIEFLRQESRRLDPDPVPDRRGVSIFLREPRPLPRTGSGNIASDSWLPPSLRSRPVVRGPAHVTLTMTNLPLLETLKYIALQAGLTVKIEEYGVSIVPPDTAANPASETP